MAGGTGCRIATSTGAAPTIHLIVLRLLHFRQRGTRLGAVKAAAGWLGAHVAAGTHAGMSEDPLARLGTPSFIPHEFHTSQMSITFLERPSLFSAKQYSALWSVNVPVL